jgi:hypothetical protein
LFSSLLLTVSSTNGFYLLPPTFPSKSGLKLVCNVKIVYGNLKSETKFNVHEFEFKTVGMMCVRCRFSAETIIVNITSSELPLSQERTSIGQCGKSPSQELAQFAWQCHRQSMCTFCALAGFFMVYTTSTCRDLPSSGDGMARRDVNICKDCKGGLRKLAN